MPSRSAGGAIGAVVAAGAWLALVELGFADTLGVEADEAMTVLMLLGAGLGWFGRLRWPLGAGAGTIALLLLVQWTPWPGTLARGMVRTDPVPTRAADAIVVLSASLTTDGRLSAMAAARLLEGARLFRAGAAPRLVVSRVTSGIPGYPVDSDRDQRAILEAAGVTPELHILTPVGTTRIEAVRMAELAAPHGWHRIVVVTSAVHTRRACAAFEAVGFEVICRPSPERDFALQRMTSGTDRSQAFGQWLYEFLGWWEYRARGWVLKQPYPEKDRS